jgi:endonuclease G
MNEYHIKNRSGRFEIAQSRPDIAIEDNLKLAETIKLKRDALQDALRTGDITRDDKRFKIRQTLIESDISDPNGFERILGASDLLSVNYLTRGARAAAAVCRIRVPTQGGEWYGSGFLVGPRLLMTNNHVLSSKQEASQTEAEFNYEHDADGILNPPVQFNLAPHEIFFTDVEHDVTFVAVAPFSEGGVPIERFGYLPLIPLSGKGINGEWVTIIQHPGGEPKQMTVRNNRIITLDKGEVLDVPVAPGESRLHSGRLP